MGSTYQQRSIYIMLYTQRGGGFLKLFPGWLFLVALAKSVRSNQSTFYVPKMQFMVTIFENQKNELFRKSHIITYPKNCRIGSPSPSFEAPGVVEYALNLGCMVPENGICKPATVHLYTGFVPI